MSLSQILISIAIIAILIGISIPIWRSFSPTIDLANTSQEIIAKIRQAQQQTITEQVAYGVAFDSVNNKYQYLRLEQVLEEKTLPESVAITTVNLENNKIVFTASGAPINSGTIELTNSKGKTVIIEIKPSGYVRKQ